MTPADELRTAATRLRQLATAASTGRSGEPTAHWQFTEERLDSGKALGSGMLHAVDDLDADADARLGKDLMHGRSGPRGRAPSMAAQHGTYIAAMDPATGLALAKWLEEAARHYDAAVTAADDVFRNDPAGHTAFLTTGPGAPSEHALAVARAINGSQP